MDPTPTLLERIASEQFLVEKYCRLAPEFAFSAFEGDDSYAIDAARVVIAAMEADLAGEGFSGDEARRYAPVFANLLKDVRVQSALVDSGHAILEQERVTPSTPVYHGIAVSVEQFDRLYDAYIGQWSRCRLEDPLYTPLIAEMHVQAECSQGEQFAQYGVLGALHTMGDCILFEHPREG